MGTFLPYMTKSWFIQSVADTARGRYSLTQTTQQPLRLRLYEDVDVTHAISEGNYLVSCARFIGYVELERPVRSETDQRKGVDNSPPFSRTPFGPRSIPTTVPSGGFRKKDLGKSPFFAVKITVFFFLGQIT